MARAAREALRTARRELAPDTGAKRLLPPIAEGAAPRELLTAFAAEQYRFNV